MGQRKGKEIAAGAFKAQCLKLMDEVAGRRVRIRITKRGKVIAELVPASDQAAQPLYGAMRDSATILGDIVAPTGESWDADRE